MNFLSVRKPMKADTIEQQVMMVTENIFETIQGSVTHIKRQLLDDGQVYSLQFPGYKWNFKTGGEHNVIFL